MHAAGDLFAGRRGEGSRPWRVGLSTHAEPVVRSEARTRVVGALVDDDLPAATLVVLRAHLNARPTRSEPVTPQLALPSPGSTCTAISSRHWRQRWTSA